MFVTNLEKFDLQVEVCDDHLLMIVPCRCEDLTVPYQQAYIVGETLEVAAEDIPNKTIDPVADELLSQGLKITRHRTTHVVFVFDYNDRIKLSYEAARIVGRSIRRMAQDLDLLNRGIHILYNVPGREGRPTPFWDADRMKKTFRSH